MAEEKKDYVEIKLPKVGKPKNLLVSVLIVLVMLLSFGLGAMYMQIQNLQNGVLGSANNQAKTLTDGLVSYAKQLGLKEDQFKTCFTSQKYLSRVNNQVQEGTTLGVGATPTFYINGKMLAGAFPVEQFRNIIEKELDGSGSTDATAYDDILQEAYNSQQRSFDPNPKDVPVGDSPIKGANNAKVTIVEFSDFQCPFCERAFPTVNEIMKEYPKEVRLVYKHYPLTSIHPLATPAALAAECAREQNKFYEYHDLLFKNQASWTQLPQAEPSNV